MSKKDYKVGRGKPPREHQFTKGASGNPRGRPRGARNLNSRIIAAASEKVIATQENGRQKAITKLDALITQALNKAAKGDLAAIKFVLGIIERAQAALDAQAGAVDPDAQRERDKALIEAFRKQLLGKEVKDGGEG